MSAASKALVELIEVEQLEVNLYRGAGAGGETPQRIFGGQVISQALSAAYRTVGDKRLCHSLHAYFMRAGDPSAPVIYEVERARDGGSFTTRRVAAIQHGQQILNLSTSFHIQETGHTHQHSMPDVPRPDELLSDLEWRSQFADQVPEKHHAEFLRERPIEIRQVDPVDIFAPKHQSDRHQHWFRTSAAMGQEQPIQHALLAYASDHRLVLSALRPNGLSMNKGDVMVASLDHALWFHQPTDFSQWHLFDMDAPFAGGARGINRGLIYNESGELVASAVQEGLMRPLAQQSSQT